MDEIGTLKERRRKIQIAYLKNEEGIKFRECFYHLVHRLLSFCLLPTNIKFKIPGAIILPGGADKASAGPPPREPLGRMAHKHTKP